MAVRNDAAKAFAPLAEPFGMHRGGERNGWCGDANLAAGATVQRKRTNGIRKTGSDEQLGGRRCDGCPRKPRQGDGQLVAPRRCDNCARRRVHITRNCLLPSPHESDQLNASVSQRLAPTAPELFPDFKRHQGRATDEPDQPTDSPWRLAHFNRPNSRRTCNPIEVDARRIRLDVRRDSVVRNCQANHARWSSCYPPHPPARIKQGESTHRRFTLRIAHAGHDTAVACRRYRGDRPEPKKPAPIGNAQVLDKPDTVALRARNSPDALEERGGRERECTAESVPHCEVNE